MTEFVNYETQDNVGIVTINHPPVNSLSPQVISELDSVFKQIEADDSVRAVVLTGEGPKFFVAGADIKAMATMDAAGAEDLAKNGQETINRLENMPKLTICAMNGLALGGGLEIAMACDLRLCAEHASMGQPEIDLGIIPGFGGTQRLPRIIGRGRALEMLLSGAPIDAKTAYDWGLVNHVYSAEELMPKALKLAKKVAAKAPVAAQLICNAVETGCATSLSDGLSIEVSNFQKAFATEDKNEGFKAFIEKRKPSFQGK